MIEDFKIINAVGMDKKIHIHGNITENERCLLIFAIKHERERILEELGL